MNRIRELRKAANKTIYDIFRELNIVTSAQSRYENGISEPPYAILCQYADYFGVSVDYILGRDEAQPTLSLKEKESLITVERLEALGFDIEKIASLTDVQLAKVEAYIQGLLDKK